MKVVLSTPPGKTTELWPPLGLLYIASSSAAKRRDDVKVIDAFCENLTREQLVSRVVDMKPDVFGVNCSTHTFLDAIGTLRLLRQALPETTLVLGGYHATFAADRILKKYPIVDFIVKGEAELTFPELLERIESGRKPSDVDGVSYLDDGRLMSNPPKLIKDLDALPFPDRTLADAVDYGYFHDNIRLTTGKFTTISSSRGCPFRCAYCSCAAFAEMKWRPRSPENVADELQILHDQGYKNCVFVDDNLTNSRKRIERICDLIVERGIRMEFYCEGRVDNASPELMRKMKKAGFMVMYFGVESSQQHVLDYYRKTITPQESTKAIANAKDAGMLVVSSFIFGAPVETLEDMEKTVEFIRNARPHAVQINILDCLIGTEIWERLEKTGVVGPDDWERNHRIYEYNREGPSGKDICAMVDRGNAASLDTWKSVDGLFDFIRTMGHNRTARTLIRRNIFNPAALKRFSKGQKPKEVQMPLPAEASSTGSQT